MHLISSVVKMELWNWDTAVSQFNSYLDSIFNRISLCPCQWFKFSLWFIRSIFWSFFSQNPLGPLRIKNHSKNGPNAVYNPNKRIGMLLAATTGDVISSGIIRQMRGRRNFDKPWRNWRYKIQRDAYGYSKNCTGNSQTWKQRMNRTFYLLCQDPFFVVFS